MSKTKLMERLLQTSILAGAVMFASPVYAQEQIPEADVAEEDSDTIVVTGSRIGRDASYGSVGPVSVFGNEEIVASGKINIGEFLQEIPAAQSLASDGTFVNNGSSGVTTLNLRGVGTERNLTLFNGRRVAPSGTGIDNVVDLSIFPVAIIDRVEVLLDGAAAVYGSDAMSGVVNFITVSDFEGVTVDATFGQSGMGDAEEFSGSITMGQRYDNGGFVFAASYASSQPLFQDERDISDCPELDSFYTSLLDNYPSAYGDNLRGAGGGSYCSGSSFIPNGRFFTSGGSRTITEDGDQAFNFFQDFYNFNPLNYIVAPRETMGVFFIGDYDVNDNLNLDVELLYSKRQSKQQLAPVPMGSGAQFTYGLTIPEDNPFNIYGEDLAYRKRMLDVGPRKPDQEADTIRFVVGADGEFGSGIQYETYVSYESFFSANSMENLIDMFRVEQALNVEETTVTGFGTAQVGGLSYRCADETARALGCTPLNLFGPNSITAEAADYIGFTSNNILKTESISFGGYLTKNDLFTLPAGDVAISGGVEYREIDGSEEVDSLTAQGMSSGNPRNSTNGGYTGYDVFAEVEVPLVSDQPFAHELSLNGAYRISEFDTFEGADVYRLGASWAPVEDLRFRATASTSYRAPSLSDLFNGGSGGFPTYSDPCRNSTFSNLTAEEQAIATVQCAAEGVDTATFASNNGQLLAFSVGNPDLVPEEGEMFTAGLVYQASSGPLADLNFRAAIDYWQLELSNAVTTSGTQATINNCYIEGDADACALVVRQTGGDLQQVFTANINSDAINNYEGVDFRFDAGKEVGPGYLKANLVGTYLLEQTDQNEDGVTDDFVGECYGFTVSCYNRTRINTYVDYALEDWAFRWSTRFLSATEEQSAGFTDGVANDDYDPESAEIDAYWYHNIDVTYQVNETFGLTFSVDNVLDEEAPYYKEYGGFFDPTENTPLGTYDVVGRYFSLRVKADF